MVFRKYDVGSEEGVVEDVGSPVAEVVGLVACSGRHRAVEDAVARQERMVLEYPSHNPVSGSHLDDVEDAAEHCRKTADGVG